MNWGAHWATSHAECGISHKTLLINKQNYTWHQEYQEYMQIHFILWCYNEDDVIMCSIDIYWKHLILTFWNYRILTQTCDRTLGSACRCLHEQQSVQQINEFTLEWWSYAQATLPGFSKQSLCVPFFNFTSLVSLPWRQLYEKCHYNMYYYSWLGYPLSH